MRRARLRLTENERCIIDLLKKGCLLDFETKGIMPKHRERASIRAYPWIVRKHPELKRLLDFSLPVNRQTFKKFLRLGIIRIDHIKPETHVYSSRFLTKKSIEKINSLHRGLGLKWRLGERE